MQRIFALFVGVAVAATTLHVSAQGPKVGAGARGAARGAAASGPNQAQIVTPNLSPGFQVTVVSTIQVNAVTSTNNPIPFATVRLRSATTGRVLPVQLTDQMGTYVFRGLDAGSYIVELMGNDQTIMAATRIINLNEAETVTVIVKLPSRIPPFGGLLGNSTPAAISVTALAAAIGVAATTGAADSPAASGIR